MATLNETATNQGKNNLANAHTAASLDRDVDEEFFADDEESMFSVEALKTMGTRTTAFAKRHPLSLGLGAVTIGAGVLIATGAFSEVGSKIKTLSRNYGKRQGSGDGRAEAGKKSKRKKKNSK